MRSTRARALPVLSLLLVGALGTGPLAPASADDSPAPVSPVGTPAPSAPGGEPAPSTPTTSTASTAPTVPTVPTAPLAAPTAPPAAATATAARPTITLGATAPGRMDRPTTLTATARDADGRPLPGRTVQLERGGGRLWTRVGTLTTVADGTATLPTRLPTPSTTYRAILMPAAAGDLAYASAPWTVTAPPAPTSTTLTAPASVVDERTVRLDIASSTTADAAGAGVPVPARVTVERRLGNGAWTPAATVQLNTAGTGSFTFAPRVTASYRVTTPAGAFWTGSVSSPRTITNLPPGTVVHLPAGSPQPRSMAAQPRATTAGVGAVVGAISSAQWARMSGVSWHSGCPVGRSGLRTVDVNYWAFDGYRRRGRLVVNARAVKQYVAAFTGLYNAKVPIRRIYPSETFGYAKASHGANDYLAMQSDNTSAFNCRWVTGRPGVNSPHSTGYAVDINTFENPYHTVKDGWLPNTWWPARSFGLIAWRSQSAVVVSIMRRSGFAWTYGTQDSQHFDVRR